MGAHTRKGGGAMKRAWIGIALLAASWLFGLSYYHQANPFWWIAGVIAGTALLIGPVRRTPPAPNPYSPAPIFDKMSATDCQHKQCCA